MKKCPACERSYETTNTLCPVDGAVLEKMTDELIGQTLAGKYRIEEYINAGGMASVYRATHLLMEKRVAIKILHSSLAADGTIVERFKREARAASRLSHPHALNVTDFGDTEDGIVYLVMEYLDGRTLKEVIHTESPLALERVSNIVKQACGALDAAHAEAVVHRDLKSDNIMLIAVGGFKDWVKVLDFGIAKIQEPIGQDAALTAPNIVIGTPHYMSPEQCQQSPDIDFRSDIYSFGVILYEMLTGQVPFSGDSPTATMMKHIQESAPSVLDKRPDFAPAVAQVVAKALEKNPEDRFQSAGALAVAFDEATNDAARTGTQEVLATTANASIAPTYSSSNDATLIQGAGNQRTLSSNDFTVAAMPELSPAEKAAAAYANAQATKPAGARRFILPAILLSAAALFGAYFYNSRSTLREANPNAAQQPLNADPQAQAAQPLNAPTGDAEREAEVITNTNANISAPPTESYGAAPSFNSIPFTSVPFPEDAALQNANGDAAVISSTGTNANANRNATVNANAPLNANTNQNGNANQRATNANSTDAPAARNSNTNAGRNLPSNADNTAAPPPTPAATPRQSPSRPATAAPPNG